MTSVLDRYPNLRHAYVREPIVFAALRTADERGLTDEQALAACVVDLSAALAEARERLRGRRADRDGRAAWQWTVPLALWEVVR